MDEGTTTDARVGDVERLRARVDNLDRRLSWESAAQGLDKATHDALWRGVLYGALCVIYIGACAYIIFNKSAE